MAILLASLASLCFGALAVTLRMCFRSGAHAGAVTLATTSLAFAVASAIALVAHGTRGATIHSVWPFALAGISAPGLSQIFFVRSIDLIGASRTAVLVGIAPVLSAVAAIAVLGEPIRVGLVAGTLAVVGGGLVLAWERGRPSRARTLGFVIGALAAVAIASRDNFVRWAATSNALPGTSAAAVSLATATVLGLLLYGRLPRRAVREQLPWVLASGVLLGVAYAFLLEALDRGRVTVVAPLYATESLWAVLFATLVLGRAESVGKRVLAAAVLMVAGGVLIGISR